MIAFHCIIHQTVLCTKLNEAFSALMSSMVKLINFPRCRSPLCHRQLQCFLTEVNALHDDLLLHNNIRWLSKGRALRRLWDLRYEICHFLGELTLPAAERYLDILGSNDQMADLAFLVDMMEHMNILNIKLQGRGKPVTELWPCMKAFIMKFNVFKEDVLTGGDHHFETLKHFISEWEDFDPATLQRYADFISQITNEFHKRFSQFQDIAAVIDLVNKPLAADPQGAWKQQVAKVSDHKR